MNNAQNDAFKLRMRSVTLPVLQMLNPSLEVIEQQLEVLKIKTPNLFQNTPMMMDIDSLGEQQDIHWGDLIGLLRHYGILPVGVQGGASSELKELFKDMGVGVFSPDKAGNTNKTDKDSSRTNNHVANHAEKKNMHAHAASTVISKPVRSGQQVYAEGGDLIVIASVSPGAELLADGNIHVYGTLRGRALAGIQGNKDARIFCQKLEADLVAIAGFYMTSDLLVQHQTDGYQQVMLENGRLIIHAL